MKEQRHTIFQGLSHSGIQSVCESKAAPGWLGLIYFQAPRGSPGIVANPGDLRPLVSQIC